MKKIFYILASAIVALGAVACENEGLDNINPEGKGETLSFTAEIDNTRVALDGNQTIWVEGDELEIKGYTFVCQEDGKTFIGEGDGINAAFSTDEELTVWYNEELDSSKGLNGVSMKGVGKIVSGGDAKLTFSLQCALLKYTTTEKVAFAGTALSADFELAEAGDGTTQYVAINAGEGLTLSYSVDGVECKSLTTTFEVGYIYNLGNLSAMDAVATVGGVQYASLDKAIAAAMAVESAEQVVVTLIADATIAESTSIIVNKGDDIKLDLNGNTLSSTNTRTVTHNFLFDVKGGTLTVENGEVVYTHTGDNMGWSGATTVFDVTGGGVLNMNGVKVNVSGTDMNFCVHLNNWGEVTFNAEDCEFNATYCGVRAFNSGPDMNNVTIKNSKMTGTSRAFWVQMYGSDDLGGKLYSGSTDAYDLKKVNARLNIDIFGNGNTYELSGEATSPVRYGQAASIFFNPENGNQVLGNATDLSRFAQYVNEGLENYAGKTVEVVKDIELTEAWTPVGQTGATQFQGTFDGGNKTIKGLTINAPESYSENYATGMFGWVESSAVIKNVKLDGATINGYHYVGAIAGYTSGKAKIEGCEVINSTITADPTKADTASGFNGDKVGGIVGYTNASNVISGNKVNTTVIKGYRNVGGIVGHLLGTAENNTIEGVTIVVDNTNNYKSFKIQSDYSVNHIAGSGSGTLTNNEGEATIEWGEIPESEKVYVAQVGSEKFETIEDAIAAVNGSTIELLADAGDVTISQACTINAGTYTINITAGEGYAVIDNGDKTFTVAKIAATIKGSFDGWGSGINMFAEGDYYVAKNVNFTSDVDLKFVTTAWVGGPADADIDVLCKAALGGGNNIGVAKGTYDIYLKNDSSEFYIVTTGKTYTGGGSWRLFGDKAITGINTNWSQSSYLPMWKGVDGQYYITISFTGKPYFKLYKGNGQGTDNVRSGNNGDQEVTTTGQTMYWGDSGKAFYINATSGTKTVGFNGNYIWLQ